MEDEPDHSTPLRHLLEQQDYEVLSTYRGSEALALAEKTQPDLIILDVALPESNGLRILEQLKHQEATASIPVLLLTMTDTKEEGTLLGAIDVLAKPFSQAQLPQRVNAIVRAEPQPLVLVAASTCSCRHDSHLLVVGRKDRSDVSPLQFLLAHAAAVG